MQLSNQNQMLVWAGVSSNSTGGGGGTGNWVSSGVFSNGQTANATFQVSVAGLYEVNANICVRARDGEGVDGEERYAFFQLIKATDYNSGVNYGLLCGLQVIKQVAAAILENSRFLFVHSRHNTEKKAYTPQAHPTPPTFFQLALKSLGGPLNTFDGTACALLRCLRGLVRRLDPRRLLPLLRETRFDFFLPRDFLTRFLPNRPNIYI
jgi:hypothetical protein